MRPIEWHLVLVTLNDLESHSPLAGFFKCNPSNICAAFNQISTDSVLARSLSDSWASLFYYCSNSGGSAIAEYVLRQWKDGRQREDITLKDIETLLMKNVFNEKGRYT